MTRVKLKESDHVGGGGLKSKFMHVSVKQPKSMDKFFMTEDTDHNGHISLCLSAH